MVHNRCLSSIWMTQITQSLPGIFLLTFAVVGYAAASFAQTPSVRYGNSSLSSTAPFSDSYTLGPGDRVRVDILQVPDFSGENVVLLDGSLNMPLAGRVSVRGMTLEEAAAAISAGYARILRRPVVTVTLLTARPIQIGVAGEVTSPGAYNISLEEAGQFPTITTMLETAGGITQAADLSQVQIWRPQASGSEQIITVNLLEVLQAGLLRQNLLLRDGDTVFVPTATNLDLAESAQLADASFAAKADQPISIAVVGEVFRPGPYTVAGTARTGEAGVPGSTGEGKSPTVTRAIQVAGGIKPSANIRKVQIRRPTRSGNEQIIEVDLWQLLQAGDLRQDAILQDGDTVSVPKVAEINPEEATQIASASFSPDTIRVNVVGEVDTPGVIEVPPSTPLNQALLAAGSFNTRAHRSSVTLIRLNPDGSVAKRTIDVDFSQGLNEDSNPMLSNNDVIVVRRSGLAAVSDTLGSLLLPLDSFFSLFGLPNRAISIFR